MRRPKRPAASPRGKHKEGYAIAREADPVMAQQRKAGVKLARFSKKHRG